MHFEVRKMKNHDKCLKCGSTSCEVKTIALTGGGRVIARRPSNGAYALSISAPTGSRRRVAYDIGHGEIVILHETRTDEQNCIKYYHGFVADYMSDLRGRCDIVNTIKKNGWPLPPKR